LCRDRPPDRNEWRADQSRQDPWRRLRVVGNNDNLEPTALYLYRDFQASATQAYQQPLERLGELVHAPESEEASSARC
jgi:hypothetical protein